MDFLQAVISGIVQGLTEFLPVSSTGHLVLASSAYKYFTGQPFAAGSEEIFFDIMLHVGTLIALLVYFKDDIVHLLQGFVEIIKTRRIKDNPQAKIIINLVIATFATALVVIPFKDIFEADMGNPSVVGIQIVITGILLFATEFMSAKIPARTSEIGWKRAFLMGLAQGIAVSPGISRSGSTIAAGLATGLDRVASARFSFLMSIPIIALAAVMDGMDKLGQGDIMGYNWAAIAAGTVISAIVGYYCVKYFIIYLSKHRLDVFAYYCVAIGLFMFLAFR